MNIANRFPWTMGLLFLVSLLAACAEAPPRAERVIVAQPPDRIDPSARYLFYLHNRAVEVQGRNAKTPWGEYRYDDILGALADRGFVVISEARPATQIGPYAAKIASQVNQLLAAGVPPRSITVMGFSKGGAIAVLATAAVANPAVNFVVMAGCLKPGGGRTPADLAAAGRPQGRVFSIYEQGDTEADSCAANFQGKSGVVFKESVLQGTRGHGAFLAADPVWMDPALQWAMGH